MVSDLTTLDECADYLISRLSTKDRQELMDANEDALVELHFTMGQWVRNAILLQQPRFVIALEAVDPFLHFDDLSELIIAAAWQKLRTGEVSVRDLVLRYLGEFNLDATVNALSARRP
jgi:hypothetical protein